MIRKKLPKFNYYDEFIKNADIASKMAKILIDFLNNFDSHKAKEIEESVHKLEHQADENLHSLHNFLVKDFLPPIDREDIIHIDKYMDDVIDYIDETVININILGVKELRKNIYDFVVIINKMCELQKELMEKFKASKKYEEINEIVIKTNQLEEEGDKLYESAIRSLFKEDDLLEIIKWEKIYTYVEECMDSFEKEAECIGEVALKNSI